MKFADLRRRRILKATVLTAVGTSVPALAALISTPSQTRGPFYPTEIPLDSDNDLVKVQGTDRLARGAICDLRGQVLDVEGDPVGGALVEIWQCDANGRYHHPGDRANRDRDPAFQGYGQFRTAADGRYRFRTIRPVPYPGRTPHIHYAVHAPGRTELVTQLYVRGEPLNERDFLFQRIPASQRHLVTVPFVERLTAEAALQAEFDIVVG